MTRQRSVATPADRFRDASFEIADGRATRRLVDEVILPALG